MLHAHPAIVIELGVNGLGVVRSLALHGIKVTGIYTIEAPGCFSRYCTAVRFPKLNLLFCTHQIIEKLLSLPCLQSLD